MAIQGVDLKCYILALFIRDDGERFLLGSGRYEFKDKQRHFAANTMQNDVVEVQGNDGFLLAGQVKRPGSQSFDGYIGDGTTSKQDVEEYRRDFFSFFRKNFFYQVIYIFPDGTAIQRKRGFLVDAPVVQELYQIYPEYHVALNFEDVNYYSYSENASGEEEFAESATISLSAGGSSGGLVWDELGAVAEGFQWGEIVTATGTEITVQNDSEGALPITDAKMYGDTFQQTYSGKNLFDPAASMATQFGGGNLTKTVIQDGLRMTLGSALLENPYAGAVFIIGNVADYIGKTITFSCQSVPSSQNNSRVYIGTCNASGGNRVAKMNITGTNNYNLSWTVEQDSNQYVCVVLYATASNPTAVGDYMDYLYPQLEIGSTATAYEPYVGGTASPNPDYPQEVQTVTGRQLVTVSNGSTSEDYEINLGDIELCKIGDYQDYIYRSGGEWYLHKEIGNVELNGSTTVFDIAGGMTRVSVPNPLRGESNTVLSTHFTYKWANEVGKCYISAGSGDLLAFGIPGVSTSSAAVTWLDANKPLFYYILATPTNTLITNQALIEDLNGLAGVSFSAGESQLVVSASGNLVGELEISYYGSVDFEGGGFVWEAGGPSGPTTVEVDSIENVYPIWEVKGPATNPQLSVLTTNTTLRYNGTVAAGQTLTIDMMSKTAKLNGTSVIGNVSGEWVNFVPGNNRVVYTTNNANAESSTIYWQEVVG